MKDLESNLQQKKDDIARFEEERTDLIAKVHSKTYNFTLGMLLVKLACLH